jgi:hypothetical protein
MSQRSGRSKIRRTIINTVNPATTIKYFFHIAIFPCRTKS